jgi:hypothetical protein
MPNKAMATVTKALRYRCTCRLATVAGMVPSLGFDLADTTQIPGRGEARIVPLGVLGNGKSRSVWRKNAVTGTTGGALRLQLSFVQHQVEDPHF